MSVVLRASVFGKKGVREGRGFSLGELSAAGLKVDEAFRLGVPVDRRRGTKHDDNVEKLKTYVEEAKKAGISVKKPRMTAKPKRGRVYRGLTGSGRRVRGLVK